MVNRDKLLRLIEGAKITQLRAAELIGEQTMRPCSGRAVRAWLAGTDLPSARPCPDWAVLALEARLKYLNLIA